MKPRKSSHKAPFRQCLACRTRYSKGHLLRFALDPEHRVFFDLRQRAPGRGVYVCAQYSCLQRALKRNGFQRGFRRQDIAVWKDADKAIQEIASALKQHYLEILSLGKKSGQLIQGMFKVQASLKEGSLAALVLATDISPNTFDKLKDRSVQTIFQNLDRYALGKALGSPEAVVLGWKHGTLYQRAALLYEQIQSLCPNALSSEMKNLAH